MDPQSSTTNNKQIRYQDVGQQGYDYYTNDVWHLKQHGDDEEELITKKENTRWLKSMDQFHSDESQLEFDYHLQSEWTRPKEDEAVQEVKIEKYTLQDVINSQDWSSNQESQDGGRAGGEGGSQKETAIVMYNPITDTFIGLSKPSSFSNLSNLDNLSMRNSDLESTSEEGSTNQNELWNSMRNLVIMLRSTFPMRFQGEKSDELILAIKTGHPSTVLEEDELTEEREGDYTSDLSSMITQPTKVPVLMFGSTLRHPSTAIQQHIIPMPSSGLHLGCFRKWSLHHTVCDKILHPGTGNGNGERRGDNWWEEEENVEWNKLIPQVVWRGLDTDYLPTSSHTTMKTRPQNIDHVEELVVEPAVMKRRKRRLHGHNGLGKEERVETVHDLVESHTTERYTRALSSIKEQLLPRWKGAVLSAVSCLYLSQDCLLVLTLQKLTHNSLPQYISLSQEAELEVQQGQRDGLPWANIKFSRHLGTDKLPSGLSTDSQDEDDATSRPANIMEYKYQLDLAGPSGTASSDTLDKLAMPGVLFHHVTPTQDYIHAHLTAWKHYIPIQEDLSDLKEKYIWAESHQDQAKKIALEGIEFMKQLGTPQGFGRIYEQDFVQPLRRVIDAYQPVSSLSSYGGKGSAVVDVLAQLESSGYVPILGCSGNSLDSCQPL